MTFGQIPDIEKSIVDLLNNNQDIIDIAGANSVSTEIPAGATLPRVRISLSGGIPTVQGWLQAPRINIEAWGNNKEEAFDLINAISLTLMTYENGTQVNEGTITGIRQDTGLAWSPDPDTKTARYLLGFTIYIHP